MLCILMVHMKVGIIRDPVFAAHENAPGHPERPERYEALKHMLEQHPDRSSFLKIAIRSAMRREITWVHDSEYVNQLAKTRGGRFQMLDSDTGVGPKSYDAAMRSAGGAIGAVQALLSGSVKRAFSFGRPPGHHAEKDRAMGFCLFNNVAVAAEFARREYGLQRVLIVDWDVHHGNGTQHIFYNSPHVMYFSIHQHPLYPGTGLVTETGAHGGEGHTLNLPVPPARGDTDYFYAFDSLFLPVARAFEPQLVLVSAGFDAHNLDPLAGMRLTERAFGQLTLRLLNLAEEFAGGRIAVILEGGYSLDALTRSASEVLNTLCSDEPAEWEPITGRRCGSRMQEIVGAARRNISPYWKLG